MDNPSLWQTKVAARLHDPAEKALVLFHDPAGHEGGTVRALRRRLGLDAGTDAPGLDALVRRADRWAAAADRPQWPLQRRDQGLTAPARTAADFARVDWLKAPVLIHPLSGAEHDLGSLATTDLDGLKAKSLAHLGGLLVEGPDGPDWRRTLLALWRFGPDLREEADSGRLGALWRLLPADSRVPDHSIWDHLDLTSAFAGAFAADPDGEAALLALAIGPVQGFIAAARSTSDLWAGSHLLARLAWEAMRVVCDALGPDAILFPRLRAVPQVDLWLRDDCALDADLFRDCDWARGGTDNNPLFAAALPNRFVALVPRAEARALAERVELRLREWLQGLGAEVVDALLTASGRPADGSAHCYRQMREQLGGFPEVHWAAVPFSLIREADGGPDPAQLSAAMAPFFGVAAGEPCGFLASAAWQVLRRDIAWEDGTAFFVPNPGVLYPAVYDLAERVLAASKAVRAFDQRHETGWRCSLTGETEWLTTDPAQLATSFRRRTDTLWADVAKQRPAWAKPGEHLGALPAVKRLWPTLFVRELRADLGTEARRFVVSTHAMALAHQLHRWLAAGAGLAPGCAEAIAEYGPAPAALPRRLLLEHARQPAVDDAKRLVGLLDRADELDDTAAADGLRRLVRDTLVGGKGRLETYYALILFDGDRMGAWLSDDPPHALTYRAGFHPDLRAGFDARARGNARLADYANASRALSPGRHLAISGALNDFALSLVRHVIEVEHLGRVIYAGGDDVLAMLPVADLLPALRRLRCAYSGHDPDPPPEGARLALRNGFARLDGRLLRMMGEQASASAGAVIAHHQAPLAAVLRELRAAEARAKSDGGRDALSLTLLKRAGSTQRFTAKWAEAPALLARLRDFLADPGVSRRAVFNSLEWLKDLPEPDGDGAMLAALLGYQLARQTGGRKTSIQHHDVPGLARGLTMLALQQPAGRRLGWLRDGLITAEFLARETRGGGSEEVPCTR